MNDFDLAISILQAKKRLVDDKDAEIDDLTEHLRASRAYVAAMESDDEVKDAEIARLREALAVFADDANWTKIADEDIPRLEVIVWVLDSTYPDPAAFAREALENK